MRTSHLACITLVVTLLMAATSLADTSALAQAGPSYRFDYEWDKTGYEISVGAAGTYDWSYSLSVYARTYIRGTGDPTGSEAYAYAYASALLPVSGGTSIVAEAWTQNVLDGETDSDSASNSGTVTMTGAGVVITFGDPDPEGPYPEESYAEATCNGNPQQCYAKATTTSSGSVW